MSWPDGPVGAAGIEVPTILVFALSGAYLVSPTKVAVFSELAFFSFGLCDTICKNICRTG